MTEYAKGDGVDNYMIALASGPTVFDPTNQQWHTENDGWVMLISLFAEPVANLGAPEIPEGKYTLGSAPVRVFGVLKKMSINYTIPEKTVLAPWYR